MWDGIKQFNSIDLVVGINLSKSFATVTGYSRDHANVRVIGKKDPVKFPTGSAVHSLTKSDRILT